MCAFVVFWEPEDKEHANWRPLSKGNTSEQTRGVENSTNILEGEKKANIQLMQRALNKTLTFFPPKKKQPLVSYFPAPSPHQCLFD